jgi:hypothetical protein
MLASGFTGTEKGGVTLLLALLRTIFATPQSRIDSLRAEVMKFGREGYTTTSGESVLNRNKLLRTVLKVLHQCNVGTPDMITTVIIGLTRCSVKTFSGHFAVKYREELRKKAAVQRSLRKRNNTAGLDQDAIFRALFDILDEAENLYEALCADNEWVNGCGKDLTYMKASTETIIDESDQQSMGLYASIGFGVIGWTKCKRWRAANLNRSFVWYSYDICNLTYRLLSLFLLPQSK